ncbi:MAG: hypothetical protein ACE5JZ_08385 [Kiloniellales bacterium]
MPVLDIGDGNPPGGDHVSLGTRRAAQGPEKERQDDAGGGNQAGPPPAALPALQLA